MFFILHLYSLIDCPNSPEAIKIARNTILTTGESHIMIKKIILNNKYLLSIISVFPKIKSKDIKQIQRHTAINGREEKTLTIVICSHSNTWNKLCNSLVIMNIPNKIELISKWKERNVELGWDFLLL